MGAVGQSDYFVYGAEMSLYSGKARSYLRKKGVRFETRSTLHPGYAKAVEAVGRVYQPILETEGGEFVQDTTEIIDFVEAREPGPSVYPEGPCQRLAALLLELYGDEGLIKPAMHYRWNFPERNDAFLASEFGRGIPATAIGLSEELAGKDPAEVRETVWKLVSGRMREGTVPALGVTPQSIPAIESSYADLLTRLAMHFEQHPYLLGGRPCIGDFGMIAPLYAHLGRDPEPRQLMQERAPTAMRWVERMNVADAGMAEFPGLPEAFLPEDQVPETVCAILDHMARDYLPELLSIFACVDAWLAEHPEIRPGDPVPSTSAGMGTLGPFGSHRIELRDTAIEVKVRHYSIWMAQRPIDYYRGLTGRERERANQLIDSVGLRPLFELTPRIRLERRAHQEYFAQP